MKKLDGKQREKMKAAQWAERGNWFENSPGQRPRGVSEYL